MVRLVGMTGIGVPEMDPDYAPVRRRGNGEHRRVMLEHDPEKCVAVFGKDHAPPKT
jgi:hypothetical protein